VLNGSAIRINVATMMLANVHVTEKVLGKNWLIWNRCWYLFFSGISALYW